MLAIYDGREALWQWDIGQKLLVTHEGVCEVHFKQPGEETALTVQTYDLGGQTVANVPNILLQEAGKLTAYIYVCVGDACTIQKAIFTIKPRPRPADYVYTETEVKTYSALEKRLDEIEANGVSDEQVEKAVTRYFEDNPIDAGIDFTTDATLALSPDGVLSVNTADAVEADNTLPVTSAAVAKTVADVTPVKGVDYFDGEKGDTGPAGVYLGETAPTDPTINVWVDPNGEPSGYEEWEFTLADGSTVTKRVVLV